MKKLTALVLATVMAMTLASPAFAADGVKETTLDGYDKTQNVKWQATLAGSSDIISVTIPTEIVFNISTDATDGSFGNLLSGTGTITNNSSEKKIRVEVTTVLDDENNPLLDGAAVDLYLAPTGINTEAVGAKDKLKKYSLADKKDSVLVGGTEEGNILLADEIATNGGKSDVKVYGLKSAAGGALPSVESVTITTTLKVSVPTAAA